MFVGPDGNVGVKNGGAGDQDGTARWEFQNELAIPQDEVPTLPVVIIPKCGDSTPAKCQVSEVSMAQATRVRSEVEGTRRPDAVEERSTKVAVFLVEFPHVGGVVLKEVGRPVSKNACR